MVCMSLCGFVCVDSVHLGTSRALQLGSHGKNVLLQPECKRNRTNQI